MSTLEDILNGLDSDDDAVELSTEYDLEKILQLDDGDDDDGDDDDVDNVNNESEHDLALIYNFPAVNTSVVREYGNLSNFTHGIDYIGEGDLSGSHLYVEDINTVPDGVVEDLVAEQILEKNSITQDNSVVDNSSDVEDSPHLRVASLSNAAYREQRFFRNESGPIVSALRAKRSAAVGHAHSQLKLSTLERISSQLRRGASYKMHGAGAASSMAASMKLIAIGTTKGMIVIFDQQEEMRQILGASATSKSENATVTALAFSMRGHLVISGHATGMLLVWDVEKGSVLKSISDLHNSRVNSVVVARSVNDNLAIEEDSDTFNFRLETDTNKRSSDQSISAGAIKGFSPVVAISADEAGVLHKISLSKSIWGSYAVESDCLLDGSSGNICATAATPALSEILSPFRGGKILGECGFADGQYKLKSRFLAAAGASHFFAMNVGSHTWIIQLSPSIAVLHKWKLPAGSTARSAHLDWSWANKNDPAGREGGWKPVLARSCGRKIELLIVHSVDGERSQAHSLSAAFNFLPQHVQQSPAPKLNISVEIPYSAEVKETPTLIKWLNNTRLVLVTTSGSILVLNHHLEQLDWCTQTIAPNPSIECGGGGADAHLDLERAMACCSGQKLIFCGADTVAAVQIPSFFEAAEEMINNGQWLDALALILEKNAADLNMESESDKMNQVIVKYVQLAVKQPVIMSVSSAARHRNHFHLVAGVCIEFCIGTNAFDVLFGAIFDIFTTVQQQIVFLESLEPYILHSEITILPQRVLVQFCKCLRQAHRLSALERCIIRLDLNGIDVKFLVPFLCDNHMYSAFLFTYSKGIGDYAAAFNILFHKVFTATSAVSSREESANQQVEGPNSGTTGEASAGEQPHREAHIVYKLLVFLLCTFERKEFPLQTDAGARLTVLQQWSLLELLCRETLSPPPAEFRIQLDAAASSGCTPFRFPYLRILCDTDPAALIHCVHKGVLFVQALSDGSATASGGDSLSPFSGLTLHSDGNGSGGDVVDVKNEMGAIYDALLHFCEHYDSSREVTYDGSTGDADIAGRNHDRSLSRRSEEPRDGLKSFFFDSFLPTIVKSTNRLSNFFLSRLIEHCTHCAGDRRKLRESQLKIITQVQARFAVDNAKLKEQLCLGNFWIASLQLIRVETSAAQKFLAPQRYSPALQFYLSLSIEEAVGNRDSACGARCTFSVFDYIKQEFDLLNLVIDEHTHAARAEALCAEVLSSISRLFDIDSVACKEIVRIHLLRHVSQLIVCTNHDPHMQFELLHSIVQRCDRSTIDSTQLGTIQDDMHMQFADIFDRENILVYFNLLCKYDANSALVFLKEHDCAYPVDDCLRICGEYGISEATAHLMEKAGDTAEALKMLLIDFSTQLKAARKDIDSQLRTDQRMRQQHLGQSNILEDNQHSKISQSIVSKILAHHGNERSELISSLPVCNGLSNIVNCAADLCDRHSSSGSSDMWFQIFDHLLLERRTVSSSGELVIALVGLMLQLLMSRMKGSIDPQDIIRRVTSHGNSAGMRLGEFKDVVLNMISANEQEILLYEAINRAFNDDLVIIHRNKIQLLRRCHVKGDHEEDEEEEDTCEKRRANLLLNRDSAITDGSESGPGGDALFEELGKINTNIDLTQIKVPAIPWSKPDVKEDFRKWKLAVGRNNEVSIRTTLPADMSDILFQQEEMEARHPGTLNATAVYHASLSFAISE